MRRTNVCFCSTRCHHDCEKHSTRSTKSKGLLPQPGHIMIIDVVVISEVKLKYNLFRSDILHLKFPFGNLCLVSLAWIVHKHILHLKTLTAKTFQGCFSTCSIAIIVTISWLQPISPELRSILARVGWIGNSDICSPRGWLSSPLSSRAPRA